MKILDLGKYFLSSSLDIISLAKLGRPCLDLVNIIEVRVLSKYI